MEISLFQNLFENLGDWFFPILEGTEKRGSHLPSKKRNCVGTLCKRRENPIFQKPIIFLLVQKVCKLLHQPYHQHFFSTPICNFPSPRRIPRVSQKWPRPPYIYISPKSGICPLYIYNCCPEGIYTSVSNK